MKVSVITVCLCAEKSIEKTILSVIAQDYANIEYIIIDGASTDGTMRIVEKYKPRIAAIVSEKDNGVFDAMNKGLKLASGDLICFLNADDAFYDERTVGAIAAEFHKSPEADIVYGKLFFINIPAGLHFDSDQYNKERKTKLDMRLWSMPHQASFAKKELFKSIGNFNPRHRRGADYDWFLRCHNAGVKMKFIDRYISFYSCAGLSSRDRYRQIPERVELAYKNSSLILFSAYAILALAKFIGGAFWEYIAGPIRKLLWRNTKAR